MTPRPRNPGTNGELITILAQLLATYGPRIDRARQTLTTAADPIRSTNTDRTTGSRETALPMMSRECRDAIEIRRQLDAAVWAVRDAERVFASILHDWAPLPVRKGMGDSENSALWCTNHLKHGHREPRSSDGSRNCDWCRDVHRNFGKWPTEALVRMHAEGRRIDETTYRKLLGKGVGVIARARFLC